jgi:excinuclease UvrABC nuclease subunit
MNLFSASNEVEFTIVNSEQDAFLLENSLIKEFQPRFNIDLKDDKSYPYMVFKNEHFPRIFLTRRKINDGSEYLGPFTSVAKVRELLDFIKATIQLRTCNLNLTPKNIERGNSKYASNIILVIAKVRAKENKVKKIIPKSCAGKEYNEGKSYSRYQSFQKRDEAVCY